MTQTLQLLEETISSVSGPIIMLCAFISILLVIIAAAAYDHYFSTKQNRKARNRLRLRTIKVKFSIPTFKRIEEVAKDNGTTTSKVIAMLVVKSLDTLQRKDKS